MTTSSQADPVIQQGDPRAIARPARETTIRQRMMSSGDLEELLQQLYAVTGEEIGVDGMSYCRDEARFHWQAGVPGTHRADYTLNSRSGNFGTLRISRRNQRFTETELQTFERIIACAIGPLQYQWVQETARSAPRVGEKHVPEGENLLAFLQETCAGPADEHQVALMLVEIEQLDALRELHGERAADKLQADVAAYLADHMQDCDQVYRVGGRQVALALRYATDKRVHLVTQLVQILMMGKVFTIGNQETEVNVTTGSAQHEPLDTPRKLLDRAQLALLLARQSRRMEPAPVLPEHGAGRAA